MRTLLTISLFLNGVLVFLLIRGAWTPAGLLLPTGRRTSIQAPAVPAATASSKSPATIPHKSVVRLPFQVFSALLYKQRVSPHINPSITERLPDVLRILKVSSTDAILSMAEIHEANLSELAQHSGRPSQESGVHKFDVAIPTASLAPIVSAYSADLVELTDSATAAAIIDLTLSDLLERDVVSYTLEARVRESKVLWRKYNATQASGDSPVSAEGYASDRHLADFIDNYFPAIWSEAGWQKH